jgi:hypothetical protein
MRSAGPVLISYVGPDQMWAEWISEQLERASVVTETRRWSAEPGTDLVSTIERVADSYSQFFIVLSSSYLRAVMVRPETSEAVVDWAMRHPNALVPVMVRRCELPPRFWTLDPVDLRELTDDRIAGRRLTARSAGLTGQPARDSASAPMTRFPGVRPPVWSQGIPARNIHFTGRDGMLGDLRKRLTTDITALLPHSLSGQAGVGKTQLATEYAYRFGADYDIVWWIAAETRASARHGLADLALRLDLGGPAAEIGELIRAALDALRTGRPYQRWLLIFDNAGGLDDIKPLLPSGSGHVLITSRDQGWESLADVLDVDVYSRAESTGYLRHRIRSLTEAEADQLADQLGDLPLALEHVAGWLSTTRMTPADYLTELRSHAKELLASPRPANYPASVATTLTISLNQLREQNPAAAQLLELCAFIGPEQIPLTLLSAAPDTVPAALATALTAPSGLTGVLEAIRAYSLAHIAEGAVDAPFPGPTIQQHRLVQAVIRDMVPAAERPGYQTAARRLLAAADPGDPEPPGTWPAYTALLPHVLSSGAATDPDPAVRPLVQHEARLMWRRGEFRTCYSLVMEAIQHWSATLDEAEPDMFLAYRERSNAMQGLGMFTEALREDQAVYDLAVRRLGADDPITVRAEGLLAWSLRRVGDFATACTLDEHAYNVALRDCGRDHPETLRMAHNLAVNYRMTGEFDRALQIDEYNTQVARSQDGPDTRATLHAVNNVARDLREVGQYYEALSLQEDTYTRYRHVFGVDNPDTLRAMKNLAVTRRKAGRYPESAGLAEEVLDRHRRRYSGVHPETLAATTNLANDYRCLGEHAKGLGLAGLAVRGFRQILGESHGFTASAVVNLAALIRLTGDPDQARTSNEQALRHLGAAFGSGHRYTLSCAVNLASDLAALGEFNAARDLGTGTLAALREVSGEDHPYTLSCAINLALDLRALGERDAFRDLYADTMARYQRTLGATHPETVSAAARERAVCDIEPPPI